MTVGFAEPIRMLTFSFMNTRKANNSMRVDRPERAVVAGLQLRNGVDHLVDTFKSRTGKIAEGCKGISESIKAARNASSAFDVICKGVNFAASKLVNPILCVASAVRAWKAEDKKSAAIKEAGAMGFMFLGEGVYKSLFGLGGKTATYTNYKLLNKGGQLLEKFVTTNKYLSKLPSSGVFGLIKGLGFIAVSCAMFAIGGHIGKKVADSTTAKSFAEKKAMESNTANNSNFQMTC